MNVVLAAGGVAGVEMVRTLARSKHRLVAVFASPTDTETKAASVWNLARNLGLRTLPAKLVKDSNTAEALRSERVDIFLNVHSLYVVQEKILAAVRLGAFNLHPGPLPRYAGLNPVSWAIYRGERTHGVTVHKMEPGIDTGPIVYQSFFPIQDSATALSVSLECSRKGVRRMCQLLEVASTESHRIRLFPQDLKRREYFGRDVPNNGRISWVWPANIVLNLVRACDYLPFRSPWGEARTRLGDQEIAVLKAKATGLCCDIHPGTVGQVFDSGAHVATSSDWVLVQKLRIGHRYANAADVLKPGDHLISETREPKLC